MWKNRRINVGDFGGPLSRTPSSGKDDSLHSHEITHYAEKSRSGSNRIGDSQPFSKVDCASVERGFQLAFLVHSVLVDFLVKLAFREPIRIPAWNAGLPPGIDHFDLGARIE